MRADLRHWLRVLAWATLPATAGPGASDALDTFRDAPRIVGAVILWGAWLLGLVAVLAPRPRGLTFARTAAPVAVVLALAAVIDGRIEDLVAVGAVAGTVVAAAFITDPDFALASVNGDSYGNERRFPLVTPPALYLGPLPVVRALAAAAVVVPPLLLADEQWVAGAITAVVAVPIMLAASRALHSLSRRFVVLVPAGIVIADPMTLADPVLFTREHVMLLRAVPSTAALSDDELDLRLGATRGSARLVLDHPADLLRARRGRAASAMVKAPALRVAVVARGQMLAAAAQRRLRVEVDRAVRSRRDAASDQGLPVVQRDNLAGGDPRLR